MRSLLAFIVAFLLSPATSIAQQYIDGGNTRHRFAQTTVGIDLSHGPAGMNNEIGTKLSPLLSSFSEARLLIGGTHFWGHADFYLAIPLVRDKVSPFRTGVETGAKYYPFRLRYKSIVPFAGIAFAANTYSLADGPEKKWFSTPVSAGLSYLSKAGLFEVYAAYDFHSSPGYYISPTQTASLRIPKARFGISYKRVFDTTLSAEKDWKSGRTKLLTDTLAVMKRLDGITIGAGPSSSFFLTSPEADEATPSLGSHRDAPLFADLAVGYYLHQPDLQIQVAYRSMHSKTSAYGSSQQLKRTSLAIEGFKFLLDYHGFCFFAGPSISREWWATDTNLSGRATETVKTQKIQPGIVLGWDIRPNRLQSMYLRTHLRWYPGMTVRNHEGTIRADQLEFNYIQLVIFPGRML